MKAQRPLPTEREIKTFIEILLRWSQHSLREFPWRDEGSSEYEMVISEILLQRTKAVTVSNALPEFLQKFPSWASIRKSDVDTLENNLKPLGLFKRRASALKDLACVLEKTDDKIPSTREEIEKLPGVGQYIANAIEMLVFNKPKPLLDVNMARVLERYFGPRQLSDIRYDRYLQNLAKEIVELSDSPTRLNFAILDYADAVCKQKPTCKNCALKEKCLFFINSYAFD